MSGSASTLTREELQGLVKAVEPAALLVRPRILRRVVAYDRNLPHIGLNVPHLVCYVIDRARLLTIVELDELDVPAQFSLPETVILLPQPDADLLAKTAGPLVLLRYWRLLFHARVHVALEQKTKDGKLTEAHVQSRLARIGAPAFREIAEVLRQENILLPPADERSTYVEFAACFLELEHFFPSLLPIFFPGITDTAAVHELLASDIDVEALLRSTRLEGAADPVLTVQHEDEGEEEPAASEPVPLAGANAKPVNPLARTAAEWAAKRGNSVRAAVLYLRSAVGAEPQSAQQAEADAHAEIGKLAARLQAALRFPAEETETWRTRLLTLLRPCAIGFIWSVPARLLYDLQKICLAYERPPFKLDFVEWAISFGARPIKRHLPGQELVLALKWLRKALSRLPSAGLKGPERAALAALLIEAVEHTAHRLRDRFRPILRATLEEVGLHPQNLPEQVARDKLIEEGLDRMIDGGLLTMGDFRDALSRNQLKLPDLAGPREFFGGDPLIRANRLLAVRLDGIYHRGEIYLRWLQRLSSVAFGTRPGRFVTQYIALPFGSAFVILKGAEEITDLIDKLARSRTPAPAELELAQTRAHHHHGPQLLNEYSFFLLGFFLLALIHVPAFRNVVGNALATLWRGTRWLFYDLPVAFGQLPAIQAFFASKPFQLAKQFLLKPLSVSAPLSLVFPLCHADHITWAMGGTAIFVLTAILLNTRLGRLLEEVLTDRLVRAWEHVHSDILPNVVRLIVGVFKRFLEGFERLFYSVDQWLRFRQGESTVALIAKLILGVGWFFATYIIRVFINLFVEPTFNPIKHFPVVTVTAKLLVPMIPSLVEIIVTVLGPILGKAGAGVIAGFVIFFIPGLAGFLVWELKENWRLYRSNRSLVLRPVIIGHHGETLRRLLRPGFHSGTVPKLYAKLRKTSRSERWKAFRKYRDSLDHAEEAVRHFVEREFVALLRGCPHWGARKIEVGTVHLSTNTIGVQLTAPDQPAPAAWIEFTVSGGLMHACLAVPGWVSSLEGEARQVFDRALAGLFKLAAADQCGQDLAAQEWVKKWSS